MGSVVKRRFAILALKTWRFLGDLIDVRQNTTKTAAPFASKLYVTSYVTDHVIGMLPLRIRARMFGWGSQWKA